MRLFSALTAAAAFSLSTSRHRCAVSAARAYPGVEAGCSIGASFSRGPSYRTQSTPPSRVSTEAYFTPSTHARDPSGVCIMSPGANPKGAQWSTPSSWVMYAGPFFLPPFLPPFLGGMTLTPGDSRPRAPSDAIANFGVFVVVPLAAIQKSKREIRETPDGAKSRAKRQVARFFGKRRSDSHVVFPTPSQRADVRAPHSWSRASDTPPRASIMSASLVFRTASLGRRLVSAKAPASRPTPRGRDVGRRFEKMTTLRCSARCARSTLARS